MARKYVIMRVLRDFEVDLFRGLLALPRHYTFNFDKEDVLGGFRTVLRIALSHEHPPMTASIQ